MITGESLDQHGGKLKLTVHENHLIRDEHIFENHHRLLPTVLRVAGIDRATLGAARVAGLPAVYVSDTGRVYR